MQQIKSLADRATEALTRWDAEQLEQLEAEARQLQTLLPAGGCTVAEVPARLRVFAAVLRGTQENLNVLRRLRAG